MALNPSADVTFFPKLVELAGGASRNIRIGINAAMARASNGRFACSSRSSRISRRWRPTRFTLHDLPIETGLENARVIIRDAFGREQWMDLGYYLSTQLLKRGEQDYSCVAGFERTTSGAKVEYGRAMGTALHRIGLADWLVRSRDWGLGQSLRATHKLNAI